MTFSCLKYHFFLEVKIKVTTFVVAKTPCYAFDCSGCSTVGSAPRSGRGGRKFESSHPDKIASYKVAALQSSNLVWRKTTACCREMQGFGSHCFDF